MMTVKNIFDSWKG